MKESYGEDLASHTDPESCAVAREGGCEALAGARAGGLLSREIIRIRGADVVSLSGRQHPMHRYGKRYGNPARSENLSMHGNISRENREIPCLPVTYGAAGRIGKSKDNSQ
jgi:RNA-directed DNA polymerase